jgi:hypothetical protein
MDASMEPLLYAQCSPGEIQQHSAYAAELDEKAHLHARARKELYQSYIDLALGFRDPDVQARLLCSCPDAFKGELSRFGDLGTALRRLRENLMYHDRYRPDRDATTEEVDEIIKKWHVTMDDHAETMKTLKASYRRAMRELLVMQGVLPDRELKYQPKVEQPCHTPANDASQMPPQEEEAKQAQPAEPLIPQSHGTQTLESVSVEERTEGHYTPDEKGHPTVSQLREMGRHYVVCHVTMA